MKSVCMRTFFGLNVQQSSYECVRMTSVTVTFTKRFETVFDVVPPPDSLRRAQIRNEARNAVQRMLQYDTIDSEVLFRE